MTPDEFLKARIIVEKARDQIDKKHLDDGIAHVYMVAAVNGLVIAPIDMGKDTAPEPLFSILIFPAPPGVSSAHYLFPSDQEIP